MRLLFWNHGGRNCSSNNVKKGLQFRWKLNSTSYPRWLIKCQRDAAKSRIRNASRPRATVLRRSYPVGFVSSFLLVFQSRSQSCSFQKKSRPLCIQNQNYLFLHQRLQHLKKKIPHQHDMTAKLLVHYLDDSSHCTTIDKVLRFHTVIAAWHNTHHVHYHY